MNNRAIGEKAKYPRSDTAGCRVSQGQSNLQCSQEKEVSSPSTPIAMIIRTGRAINILTLPLAVPFPWQTMSATD